MEQQELSYREVEHSSSKRAARMRREWERQHNRQQLSCTQAAGGALSVSATAAMGNSPTVSSAAVHAGSRGEGPSVHHSRGASCPC
jgi:hypothetical protein